MKNHSIVADLMKSARQESAWAITAKSEAVDEAKRAEIWKTRGYPIFADELNWDSNIADKFYHLRLNRSKIYKQLARQLKEKKR